jgi:hypothetical protein
MAEGFVPLVLELRAKATEVFTELHKVNAEIDHTARNTEEKTGKMSSAMHKLGQASPAIALGMVGAGLAIGGMSVKAAMAAQTVEAQLDTSLKNAGSSMEELKPQIEGLDTKFNNLGFTTNETNDALSKMTVGLGDPKKAMEGMAVAADVARVKHIPLADASLLVTKAMEGQGRALKQLGIDNPVAAGGAKALAAAQNTLTVETQKAKTFLDAHGDAVNKNSKFHLTYMQMMDKVHAAQGKVNSVSKAGGDIMKILSDRVKGSAEAFGETTQGKLAAARAKFEKLTELIGTALLPVLNILVDVGTKVLDYLNKNPAVLNAVIVVFGVLTAAFVANTIATWAMNAAWLANPITWIVAGILLLVGLVVLLIMHWKEIGKWIGNVMTGMGKAFKSWGDSISKWWSGLWNGIVDTFKAIFNGIGAFIGGIFGAIKDSVLNVLGFIESPINGVIDTVNGLLGGLAAVTGGAIKLHLEHLPAFEQGGTIPGSYGQGVPIMAHGGEEVLSTEMLSGRKSIPSRVVDAVMGQAGQQASNRATNKEVNQHFNINVQTNATADQIASAVGWKLRMMG